MLTTNLTTHRLIFRDKDKDPIMLSQEEYDFVFSVLQSKEEYVQLVFPNGAHVFAKREVKEIVPISSAERDAYTRQKYIGYWDEIFLGREGDRTYYKKILYPLQLKGESTEDYEKRKKPIKEITGYYEPMMGFTRTEMPATVDDAKKIFSQSLKNH